MSVNGIKLAVGQQWQTRYGNKVTLQENPGMDTYVFRAVNTDNEWCSITKDGKSWETDSGSFLQRLISSPGPVQFNPRPGDKIICNNGEEYTCCTLDYMRETISTRISSDKPLFGCNDDGWQDWNADGTTHFDDYDYRIREVVPKQDAIQEDYTPLHCPLQFSTAQGFMSLNKEENPVYTTEDIRKAVIDDLGWQDSSLDLIMKSLEKVTSKEYNEYLRLKAMFEPEEDDE